MTYADFGYYRDTYRGRGIPEADFGRLSLRAGEWIDGATHGRARAFALAHPEDRRLGHAACGVAEALWALGEAQARWQGAGPVRSEHNDGYEVTYAQGPGPGEAEALAAQRCRLALQRHLCTTGLLYAGVAAW